MSTAMTNNLPSVTAVAATKKPFVLRVKWDDGANTPIDLTGLVHRSRHFGIFREDTAAFRQVRVAPDGAGIAWDNGLDYSADTLKTLADEQRPMTGRDLQRFEEKNTLNAAETAALLGVAERTVRDYRRAARLPQAIAVVLRAMEANSAIFAAHYKPIPHRPRGRPRKRAA